MFNKIQSKNQKSDILLIAIIIFSVIVINLITLFSYRQMQELEEANEWVIHSHDVIERTENLLNNILLAGNNGRAFLLTGNENYIKDLEKNEKLALDDLDSIKNLTKDNALQQGRVSEFELLFHKRFSILKEMIEKRQKNEAEKNMLLDEVQNSTKLTASLNDIRLNINEEEKKLLKTRSEIVVQRSNDVQFYTMLGDALSFIILIIGMVALFNQLRLRSIAENQLQHLAYHDMLTGLVNRIYLEKSVHEAIQISQRHMEKMALVFIDIDNFKFINDKYGHDAGDFVLQVLARRLIENVRNIDVVCRMGGDEFILTLSGIHKRSDVEVALKKVVDALKDKINYQDELIPVTVSIGISIYPDDGDTPAELLKNADIAMYRAKEKLGTELEYFRNK